MSSSQTPLLSAEEPTPSGTCSPHSSNTSSTIRDPTREARSRKRESLRYVSFFSAILSCGCAGSITVYSLYGHIFQERLHYTQLEVNIVAIAANMAQYLPMTILGYMCDHIGPGVVSLISAVLFGTGYFLAAFTYKSGAQPMTEQAYEQGSPLWVMVVAFVMVGVATLGMYISAVATCAKNFSRSKYRDLALAIPGAAYGLSGTWQSQVGSRVFYETLPSGEKGDVDVFKFFFFLAILLPVIGLIGTFLLVVVDEEKLIDDAVEELERSDMLDDGIIRRGSRDYGSFQDIDGTTLIRSEEEAKAHDEEKARKKNRLLNEETRWYLKDHTMWLTAAGFFFLSGPGEAFITNLGTIIPTLEPSEKHTALATHVSIWAFTSTSVRVLGAVITDFLAPCPVTNHYQSGSNFPPRRRCFTVSHVAVLVFLGLLFSLAHFLLAAGYCQYHAERFWIISLLNGLGYGAYFSLTPIIVNTVWGSENFGTNWGIVAMVPAFSATFWGVAYSKVYEWAAEKQNFGCDGGPSDVPCYGESCYAPTFWGITVTVWLGCALWVFAWLGPNGWRSRGIAV